MEQEAIYVGIDVSKNHVDVAVRPTGQTWTISNDEPGIRELVSRLKALGPAIVVLEGLGLSTTGGRFQALYHIWYHSKAGMSCNSMRPPETLADFDVGDQDTVNGTWHRKNSAGWHVAGTP